mmetsp:Transcript_24901/g.57461  ORF Transcript_24901/g.57461 Transcript_24901/m.57461 type:complete len:1213 (-) Transcript_24901:347-3985(-)
MSLTIPMPCEENMFSSDELTPAPVLAIVAGGGTPPAASLPDAMLQLVNVPTVSDTIAMPSLPETAELEVTPLSTDVAMVSVAPGNVPTLPEPMIPAAKDSPSNLVVALAEGTSHLPDQNFVKTSVPDTETNVTSSHSTLQTPSKQRALPELEEEPSAKRPRCGIEDDAVGSSDAVATANTVATTIIAATGHTPVPVPPNSVPAHIPAPIPVPTSIPNSSLAPAPSLAPRTQTVAMAPRPSPLFPNLPPDLDPDVVPLINSLRASKNRHDNAWASRLSDLLAYRTIHGDCNVKQRDPAHPSLGKWVRNQRSQYRLLADGRHSTLTPGRRKILEAVGFRWDDAGSSSSSGTNLMHLHQLHLSASANATNPAMAAASMLWDGSELEERWDAMEKKLREYVNKYKNCAVTRGAGGDELYTWTCQIRAHYNVYKHIYEANTVKQEKNKNDGNMTMQTKALSAPTSTENSSNKIADSTADALTAISDFFKKRAETGDGSSFDSISNVPTADPSFAPSIPNSAEASTAPSEDPTDHSTGNTSTELSSLPLPSTSVTILPSTTTQQSRSNVTLLAPARITSLRSLGFDFETPPVVLPPSHLHANANSTSLQPSSEKTLPYLASLLPTLAPPSSVKKATWNERYNELVAFRHHHNHTRVPAIYPANPALGKWVSNQRTQMKLAEEGKKSTMTAERKAILNAAGFFWGDPTGQLSWRERYDDLVRYKEEHGDCLVPQTYPKNPPLGKWVSTQRVRYKQRLSGKKTAMTDERVRLLNDLGFHWGESSVTPRTPWEDRFGDLLAYKATYGDTRVPLEFLPNPQLVHWVANQRKQYKKRIAGRASTMSDERLQALENVDFCWETVSNRQPWDVRYAELVEYKRVYGNCQVPREYKSNKQLGHWVNNQRHQYKLKLEGKSSVMTDDQVERMNDIGFNWGGDVLEFVPWETRYAELLTYRDRFGNVNVPAKYPDNPKLGTWVTHQRSQYKCRKMNKPSAMSDDRIKMLEDVGFKWEDAPRWEERFGELVAYREENGDCQVPARFVDNPQLGTWVTNQRAQYKQRQEGKVSAMNDERIAQLEAIGFKWGDSARDHKPWQDRYEELVKYRMAHEDCKVPVRYPPNPQLGNWVNNQRAQYKLRVAGKKSAMTDQRFHLLEQLGFHWGGNIDQTPWEERYIELLAFREDSGHTQVSVRDPEHGHLGHWIYNQRAQYKLRKQGRPSSMTDER